MIFPLRQAASPALELTAELGFHFADDLDRWVDLLLDGDDPAQGRELAAGLERDGYHLRMTRDLEVAKTYLHERYGEAPDARHGLVASSRDRITDIYEQCSIDYVKDADITRTFFATVQNKPHWVRGREPTARIKKPAPAVDTRSWSEA
jgi:hypothetical protein